MSYQRWALDQLMQAALVDGSVCSAVENIAFMVAHPDTLADPLLLEQAVAPIGGAFRPTSRASGHRPRRLPLGQAAGAGTTLTIRLMAGAYQRRSWVHRVAISGGPEISSAPGRWWLVSHSSRSDRVGPDGGVRLTVALGAGQADGTELAQEAGQEPGQGILDASGGQMSVGWRG